MRDFIEHHLIPRMLIPVIVVKAFQAPKMVRSGFCTAGIREIRQYSVLLIFGGTAS